MPEGFYAPLLPSTDAIKGCLRLYLEEREQWNERPELGILISPLEGFVTSYPFPIPPAVWDGYDNPLLLLRKLGRVLYQEKRTDHALVRLIDPAMLTDMVGVYLRNEGWAPPQGNNSLTVDAVTAGHPLRFSEMKDRRELRSVMALTVDSTFWQCGMYRDRPADMFFRTVGGGLTNKDYLLACKRLEGIPELLTALMYGLLQTLRPTREGEPA
ncbi:MAG TPA: hypothetical protein VIM84_11070 [Gemmatimonadales bacterium]